MKQALTKFVSVGNVRLRNTDTIHKIAEYAIKCEMEIVMINLECHVQYFCQSVRLRWCMFTSVHSVQN